MHFTSNSRERMTSLRFIHFSHLGQRGLRGSVGGSAGVSGSCASSSTFSSVISRTENRLLLSNRAHGSPAAGYKILYTNWRFCFIRCLHGCYVFGGKLILQFPFYLVRVHVLDIEMEVALLCPMSGPSATPAGVGGGLGLPCRVYVHRDRVTRGWVGVGEVCGRHSRDGLGHCQRAARSRSRDIGLSVRDVECLVCRAVLIHLDCKMEPGFWVCIRRPSVCHPCEGRRDPMVKASAELDHDGFQVSVSGIVN